MYRKMMDTFSITPPPPQMHPHHHYNHDDEDAHESSRKRQRFIEEVQELGSSFDEFLEEFALEECPQGTGGYHLEMLLHRFEGLMFILGMKPLFNEDTAVAIFEVGCVNMFEEDFELPIIPNSFTFTRRLRRLADLTHAYQKVFDSLFSPYSRTLPFTAKVRSKMFARIYEFLHREFVQALKFVKTHVLSRTYRTWEVIPDVVPKIYAV
jgi:hypothetical protein